MSIKERTVLIFWNMDSILQNLHALNERIRFAAVSCGRDSSEILVVGVSKTHPVEKILTARSCGLLHFGENRVQELVPKMEAGPADAIWHMIGTLQTNKIKYLAPRVDWIQSVASVKALEEIEKRASQHQRIIKTLIQVNISDEDQKSGCSSDDLIVLLNTVQTMSYTKVYGLMGIASFEADSEVVRPQFRLLRQLFDLHRKSEMANVQMIHLSMGMSHDLETAIQEGSTMIRVGTAIFGNR